MMINVYLLEPRQVNDDNDKIGIISFYFRDAYKIKKKTL